MNIDKVDMYIMANHKYFPIESIGAIRERLLMIDDSRFMMLSSAELVDPNTLLLVSIFVGSFGIDRFLLGEIGMGLLKLFTGGVCGILTIYDWFTISKKAKDVNFNRVMMLLHSL